MLEKAELGRAAGALSHLQVIQESSSSKNQRESEIVRFRAARELPRCVRALSCVFETHESCLRASRCSLFGSDHDRIEMAMLR